MTQREHTSPADYLLEDADVIKDPGPYFHDLRTKCPVARTDAHGGFWLVSRYADVHEAALNTEIFSSAQGILIPMVPRPLVPCLEQDDPEHRIYRRPMQSWFSPGRMAKLEETVRAVVTDLIDAVVDDHTGDLISAVAAPLPPIVIAMLLGLPEDEWAWFQTQSANWLTAGARGDMAGAEAAFNELAGFLGAQLEERRQVPRDDVLTDLVRIDVDGSPISTEVAVSLAFLILVAGYETTAGALGGLLYHVGRNPDIRDRLIAEPALIPSAVEEAVRLEAPLPGLGRTLRTDTVLNGVAMSEADKVMLLFAAANRDGDVFAEPEEFKVDRSRNQHFGFGVGVHRCVGAPLARLELKVALQEVLRRLPALRVEVGDAVRVEFRTSSRVYRSLPATW